jgi:hypothetical protein
MLKKVLLVLIVLPVVFVNTFAYAATLEQAVYTVSQKLFIETKVDKNILRLYMDWGFIDENYRDAFAGALHSGLICPEGRLLRPKSNNLSPLINGMIRFSILSPTFDIIGFSGAEEITPSPDTVFIIDGEIKENFAPDANRYYYAVVSKAGRTYVIWQATPEKVLRLYRGRLFLKEGESYILKNPQKKSFGTWEDIPGGSGYTSVELLGGAVPVRDGKVISDDINLNYLDAQVYILGQESGGVIKASYFEIK